MTRQIGYKGCITDDVPRKRSDFRYRSAILKRLRIIANISAGRDFRLSASEHSKSTLRRSWCVKHALDCLHTARVLLNVDTQSSLPIGQPRPPRPPRLIWFEAASSLAPRITLQQPIRVF